MEILRLKICDEPVRRTLICLLTFVHLKLRSITFYIS